MREEREGNIKWKEWKEQEKRDGGSLERAFPYTTSYFAV